MTVNLEFNEGCIGTVKHTRSTLTFNIVEGVFQFELVILRERQIVTKVTAVTHIEEIVVVPDQKQSRVLGVNAYTSNAVLQECWFCRRSFTNLESKLSRREDLFDEERTVKLACAESFSKQDVICRIFVCTVCNTVNKISSFLCINEDRFVKNCNERDFFDTANAIDLKDSWCILFRIDSYRTTNAKVVISNEVGIAVNLINCERIPVFTSIKLLEGCIITQRIICRSMLPSYSTVCCSTCSVGGRILRRTTSSSCGILVSTIVDNITDVIDLQFCPERILRCRICCI